MSRRDEILRKQREQMMSDLISKIYLSTITESMFEAGIPSDDIKYILDQVRCKAEDLSKGYIGIDDYIASVEEKTGIPLQANDQQ